MHDSLNKARETVEKIRFLGDTMRSRNNQVFLGGDRVRSMAFTTGLQISNTLTPSLHKSLKIVCERLFIPLETVDAFVYASSDIQAECFASENQGCVIRFTSALVELLDSREFEFVVGHELGHFLLGHGEVRASQNRISLEYLIQQRAQEISVDRIGLIACGSLSVAIKALMKIISGLDGRHVRFDVGTFLTQLRHLPDSLCESHFGTTHPSTLVRCRALLWFSLSESYNNVSISDSIKNLVIIDEKIKIDLDKYVNGPAQTEIQEAKNNFAMWLKIHGIMKSGAFTKVEQRIFAEEFSPTVLESVLNFFNTIPKSEIRLEVCKRLSDARTYLESLIPLTFDDQYKQLFKK